MLVRLKQSRIVLIASLLAVFLAAATLFAWRFVEIERLLPVEDGQSVCFTATVRDRTLHVRDWSKTTRLPTGAVSPDGDPIVRPVPADRGSLNVRRFVLALDYDSRKADYDWIYNFHLSAIVDGLDAPMLAAGECPSYKAKFPGFGPPALSCYIDCDGGFLNILRPVGKSGMSIAFDPKFPLRMKVGCGGRGSFLVSTREGEPEFALAPAPLEMCRALIARDKEE